MCAPIKTPEQMAVEKHDMEITKTNTVLRWRNRGYFLTMIYLAIVCAMSCSLLITFWMLVLGFKTPVAVTGIASLGAGTAGLGAGSLIFKVPLARLFKDVN
jgi:hypothetical protein